MPIFEMTTNVGNVSDAFISQVSKEVSLLTQKDESKVCVYVTDGAKLHFGGSSKYICQLRFEYRKLKVLFSITLHNLFSQFRDV